jgi:hypothetical protein
MTWSQHAGPYRVARRDTTNGALRPRLLTAQTDIHAVAFIVAVALGATRSDELRTALEACRRGVVGRLTNRRVLARTRTRCAAVRPAPPRPKRM